MNLTHVSTFRESAESISPPKPQDSLQNSNVKSIPTVEQSSELTGQTHHSTPTLENWMETTSSEHAVEHQHCSQVDFPANQAAQQDAEKDPKMNGGSGQSSLDSFGNQSPIGLLAKMLQDSSLWASSQECSLKWKTSVMKSGHLSYRLHLSERRTKDTGSSLWVHTPLAGDADVPKVAPSAIRKRDFGLRLPVFAALADAGEIYLPTPKASDHHRSKVALADLGLIYLPTPVASQNHKPLRKFCKSEKTGGKHGKMLPAVLGEMAPSLIGKRIHPHFVEWMMGFPIDWTLPDSKHLETLSSQRKSTQYLKQSQKLKEVTSDDTHR